MNDGRAPKMLAMTALLAAVYFVAGKIGAMLAPAHGLATVVWPPTGIALGALIVLGSRVWPGLFVGAFFLNLSTTASLPISLGITLGNLLEALAGAALIRTYAHGRHVFERPWDIVKFSVLAGLVSSTIAPTVGVTTLATGGYVEWAMSGSAWLTWWLGDAGGALLITPVFVLWSARPFVRWSSAKALEAAVLLVVVLVVGQLVFGALSADGLPTYPLAYLCVPILVWAAFRFGPRETANVALLVAGLATWGTLHGSGPFAMGRDPRQALVLLHVFMGSSAVLGLAMAAVVANRRKVEEARERLIRKLEGALQQIKTLRGLLPICASCKKIRNEQDEWDYLEVYIERHSEARFTHGICPECQTTLYGHLIKKAR